MCAVRTVCFRYRSPSSPVGWPPATPVSCAILLALLALLTTGAFISPAVASPAPGAVISSAEYMVSAGDRFAQVTATLKVLALAEGWQTTQLFPSAMPLRSFKVKGKKGYIERTASHYVAHLLGEGKYAIDLSLVLDVQQHGPTRFIRLPLVSSAGARITFQFDQPHHLVKTTPEVPIEPASDAECTRVSIYPGDVDVLTISWLPSELERKLAALFEAREESLVLLEADSAVRHTDFTIRVRRGELGSLTLVIPPGVDVLRLSGRRHPSLPEPIIDSWRIDREGPEPRIHVTLKKRFSGQFHLQITAEQAAREGAEFIRILPFRIEGAERQTGHLSIVSSPKLTVVDAGSVGMRRAAAAVPTAARFPEEVTACIKKGSRIALAFAYNKLPAELRLKMTPVAPEISATTASFVRLQPGVVELLTELKYRVEKVPLNRLRIGLEEGLIILDVAGKGIDTWQVVEGQLEVRLKEPALGDYKLTVKCVENLRRVDGVLIPQLWCLDAERQSGHIGVSAGEDVALLHYHSKKFVQVDVEELPDWVRARKPKLGYLYDQPGGVLAVSTSLIEPVLRVEGYAIARLAEDTLEEEYVFLCNVERRPLFSFRLRLPEGLVPINLVGDQVADWEFHPNQRALTVTLTRGYIGKTKLHLFAERRFEPDTGEVPLGGVTVLDAEHSRGHLGIGTDANLELLPTATRAVVPIDIKDAPPLVKTLANLRLAYRWSGKDWGMTLSIRKLIPRIEAETETALLFSTGHLLALTDVSWHIAKATVDELLVVLPTGAFNSRVTGRYIQSQELTERTWQVRLSEPVMGDYRMRVTYEQLPDRTTGGINYTGIRLPQAARQGGTIGTYLADPQVEVTVGELQNALRADVAPSADVNSSSFLGGYSYSEAQRSIAFLMKGHELERGVLLSAENYSIATVVKERGHATSYMNCRLTNAGAQFFRMQLPEGATLWGAYIEDKPVKPNKLPKGDILLPLLEAPRGRPFNLGVIWSAPVKKMGAGSSLSLTAPSLALPAQAVDWDIYLPRNYQVLSTGGNMRLAAEQLWYQQGLPGITWQYMRSAWPAVRVILIVLGLGMALAVLAYLVIRLVKFVQARQAARAAEAPAGRPVPARSAVGRLVTWLVIIVFLGVLAAILLPSLSAPRMQARGAKSAAQLKQLSIALQMYYNNYKHLPPSLDVLAEDGRYISPNLLVSPRTGERYVYGGPIDLKKAGGGVVLVWERPDEKGNAWGVYSDGHVERQHLEPGRAWDDRYTADYDPRRYHPSAKPARPGLRPGGFMYGEKAGKDIGVAQGLVTTAPPPGPGISAELALEGPPPGREGEPVRAAERSGREIRRSVTKDADRLEELQRGEAEIHARRQRLLQMAEAHRKRGEYDEALKVLGDLVLDAPDSKDAGRALEGLRELKRMAPTEEETVPYVLPLMKYPKDWRALQELREKLLKAEVKERTHSVGDLLSLSKRLKEEGGESWDADLAYTTDERNLLQLVTGEKDKLGVEGKMMGELKESQLVITGTDKEIQTLTEGINQLRGRMLEKSRAITRQKQAREAQLAVKRRAEVRRRAMTSTLKARISGGTVRGSRAVGAMPLEISFPSLGTRAYPFHMDYAGTSQARVELVCLRRGTALVLQGVIAIAVLLVVGGLSWRDVRLGAPLAGLLVLLLAYILNTGSQAMKPYIIMALVGLCLALPLVVARLVMFKQWRGRRA